MVPRPKLGSDFIFFSSSWSTRPRHTPPSYRPVASTSGSWGGLVVVKQWSVGSGGRSFEVGWHVLMFFYCGISVEMFW